MPSQEAGRRASREARSTATRRTRTSRRSEPARSKHGCSKDGTSLHYKLSYSGLEGNVTQSHVHFGKRAINGGISFFLCSNLPSPPAGTPACPGTTSGTVEGDIEAADVIGPGATVGPPPTAGQGIEPGNLAEILAAMRAGHAYANVHTTKWPGGEIRAQLNDKNFRRGHGDHKKGDDN